MKRTSIGLLAVLTLLSAGVGFLLDQVLTALGRPTFNPSLWLPVLLVLIGGASLALAWPVRKSVNGGGRIDPFRALRAVTLARASSLLGAIMAGMAVGLWAFISTRPIDPPVGSVVAMLALLAGAITLTIVALIAEKFCTLPKDPDDRQPDEPPAGAYSGN